MKEDKDVIAHSDHTQAFPHIELDISDYIDDLEEMDLTEDQARELLSILWQMMSTCVDIGWGVDTVQMFLPELFEKAGQRK
jgi:hypothetical protein